MLNAVLVIVGAVVVWLLVDRLLSMRQQWLRRGRAAWLDVGAHRTFHSTGCEETVSPLEALGPVAQNPRRRTGARATHGTR